MKHMTMSSRQKARMAGVIYLITIALGMVAQGGIADRLVKYSDAAGTAANITAHEDLFRLAFALFMIEQVAQVIVSMLFYELLKPVSRTASLLAAVLGVVGSGIKALSRLFYLAPVIVLGGAPYLNTFSTEQLHALALVSIRVNNAGAAIALVFFGFSALLQGYLIIRSTFLPHVLGWLALVGGAGWLAFLWPPLGNAMFVYIALFAIIGALAMIGWLIVVGVDDARWTAEAEAAAASIWR